jgi:hypothetical protein
MLVHALLFIVYTREREIEIINIIIASNSVLFGLSNGAIMSILMYTLLNSLRI